jgi:hypothetical protein
MAKTADYYLVPAILAKLLVFKQFQESLFLKKGGGAWDG